MRFVTGAKKHISAFISHSEEDNEQARHYEALLRKAGFSAFQYGHGLHPGEQVQSIIADKITKCHFFLFLVSDRSINSPWVQRELGMATALHKQNGGYRPIIIPLYAKDASWRISGKRPKHFLTRDFWSGKRLGSFDLGAVRGLDKYSSPYADSDDVLTSLMKPSLLVTRVDFKDEAPFYDTDVFRLYDALFPPIERDAHEDIIHWVLRSDLGKQRSILLPDRTKLTYKLDSRYFILLLADKAIGLAFFTFDHSSRLLYGNYVAVQECWRGGDVAGAFVSEIMKVTASLFPTYQGIVFEVERFDKRKIEGIIARLEQLSPDRRRFRSESDRSEVRKFLRVTWYQKLGCYFFLESGSEEPLRCTSPCLDPTSSKKRWKAMEEDYWIMWYNKPGRVLDIGAAGALWTKTVNCIYVEILGKSLVESFPNRGADYWRYVNAVVGRTLTRSKNKKVNIGKFLDRQQDDLLGRWMRLRMELPI